MTRYKVVKNDVRYLNGSGQMVSASKGTIITMHRRSDIKEALANEAIEPADQATRLATTMTTSSVDRPEVEKILAKYDVGDLVGFTRNGQEYTGEVVSISDKGGLTVNVGVEEEEKNMRVNPSKVEVEKLA